MKEEIKQVFDTIVAVVEQHRGTKQEHIILHNYLELIKKEISGCECKRSEELKKIVEPAS